VKYEKVILIPCYNEEKSIQEVVTCIKSVDPDLKIVIIDNGSTDETNLIVKQLDVELLYYSIKGKGNALIHAFEKIDSNYYLIIDGDSTYDTSKIPEILEQLKAGHDMVIACRKRPISLNLERRGHIFGNYIINLMTKIFLQIDLKDSLSGYRGFSRRYVKSFFWSAKGFEIETYFNAHAKFFGFSIYEFDSPYNPRGNESKSKLRTFPDAYIIIRTLNSLSSNVVPGLGFTILAILAVEFSIMENFSLLIQFFTFMFFFNFAILSRKLSKMRLEIIRNRMRNE
jgi:glycosyltransferase involved in cell wall biosynthesis